MSDLISVIIPVYNAAEYINDCIQSVLYQTYSYLEVLLVDDGSQDRSKELCEKWCEKDSRVQLLNQNHKGVSSARNMGIRGTKGKYIFFIDSDDMIHPQLLGTLYNLLETTHATIASETLFSDQTEIIKMKGDVCGIHARDYGYVTNEAAIQKLVCWDRETSLDVIGGKMILREALQGVLFKEDINYGEDTLFLYQLIVKGADAVVLKKDWYFYRKHIDGGGQNDTRYSISACKQRYAVKRYICRNETRNGRIQNAVQCEAGNIYTMISWYESGWERRDFEFVRYIKKLARNEIRRHIFHRLPIMDKIWFYVVFWGRPFRTKDILRKKS